MEQEEEEEELTNFEALLGGCFCFAIISWFAFWIMTLISCVVVIKNVSDGADCQQTKQLIYLSSGAFLLTFSLPFSDFASQTKNRSYLNFVAIVCVIVWYITDDYMIDTCVEESFYFSWFRFSVLVGAWSWLIGLVVLLIFYCCIFFVVITPQQSVRTPTNNQETQEQPTDGQQTQWQSQPEQHLFNQQQISQKYSQYQKQQNEQSQENPEYNPDYKTDYRTDYEREFLKA